MLRWEQFPLKNNGYALHRRGAHVKKIDINFRIESMSFYHNLVTVKPKNGG